jgi:hypothetical protein
VTSANPTANIAIPSRTPTMRDCLPSGILPSEDMLGIRELQGTCLTLAIAAG